MILSLLLSRPDIAMYDHRPSPFESLPEVVILELNGGRVMIAVHSGLYMSLYSMCVSKVVE